MPASEWSMFAQGNVNKGHGGKCGRNKRWGGNKTYDKKYWKEKECYKCVEKVHPKYHCTKTKKDKYNDDKSTRSTISRASVKKLSKDVNNMSRAFNPVNTQLQNFKYDDSDQPYSEDDDEALNFQMAKINYVKSDFKFEQLDEEFETRIVSLFNQTSGRNVGIKPKLNLREVILLGSQSTMDIFWNQALVEKTTK